MATPTQNWMYGPARIKVEGYTQVLRDLYAAGYDASDLKEITYPLAERIATTGKAIAPRKSGRLAAAIRPKKSRLSVTAYTPARIRYAPVRHWGPTGSGGTRFLSKAEEANRAATEAGIEKGISKLLDKRHL